MQYKSITSNPSRSCILPCLTTQTQLCVCVCVCVLRTTATCRFSVQPIGEMLMRRWIIFFPLYYFLLLLLPPPQLVAFGGKSRRRQSGLAASSVFSFPLPPPHSLLLDLLDFIMSDGNSARLGDASAAAEIDRAVS